MAAGSIAPACEEVPVSAVVPDFDERRDRGRDRSKTPPEAATSLDRQEICTTRHQSAPEFLQHRAEKTRAQCGFGESSGKASAALCTT